VGTGLAVAGAIAVGTVITASAFQSLPCPVTPVVVGGYTYYQFISAAPPGISPTIKGAERATWSSIPHNDHL
jgi:hypothetical protein